MAWRRTSSGFTLMELVLVLAILSVVLLAAAPNLAGFGRVRLPEEAAAQFVALTRWARSQAISDGATYRLNMDVAAGRWWLTIVDEDAVTEVESSYGRVFQVPDGVRMEATAPSIDGTQAIEFGADGRTDPSTVRFIDARGNVVEVTCELPSDVYHVVPTDGGRS